MKDRFIILWNRICSEAKGGEDIFEKIKRCYHQGHRHYHSMDHVRFCLEQFDVVRIMAENPEALELAIWYHDVVYDPKAKDNELQSCEILRRDCSKAEMRQDFIETAVCLIMATEHIRPALTIDQKLIVDIDLAILGTEEKQFDEYERGIRAEYSFVPLNQYINARCGILEAFLDRPVIYNTDFFRDKYEEAARVNITRSIKMLDLR